jgi:hypothetical protein
VQCLFVFLAGAIFTQPATRPPKQANKQTRVHACAHALMAHARKLARAGENKTSAEPIWDSYPFAGSLLGYYYHTNGILLLLLLRLLLTATAAATATPTAAAAAAAATATE